MYKCVFCNQNTITARSGDIKPEDIRRTIEEYLSSLEGRGLEEIEISFYGGSFTAIPMEEQRLFLALAKEYKDRGLVSKLRLSTRPDCIDRKILENLKDCSVDIIELGVQSFDPEVLRLSERGHGPEAVYSACELIKGYGFSFGIQLMVGLPGDSYGKCVDSARKTVEIAPNIARIYPTVILSGTKLHGMYEKGIYKPFSHDETLRSVKDMYILFKDAGINIIRVGLKSSAYIGEGSESRVVGKSYHPAFRQLVESSIALDEIVRLIDNGELDEREAEIEIITRPENISNVVGHKKVNRIFLSESYPNLNVTFRADPDEKFIRIEEVAR